MVRRTVFDKVGLFDESLNVSEDWDMWIRIIRNYDYYHIIRPLVKVRENQADNSSADGRTNLLFGMRVLDKHFADPYLSKKLFLKRKAYSYRYFASARAFKINKHLSEAKHYFWKSVFLYPLNIFERAHIAFFLKIMLGDRMFDKINQRIRGKNDIETAYSHTK